MAVVFAFVYEKYASVKAPVIAHIAANVTAVLATHFKLFDWIMADQLKSGIFTVACAAIAASMYVFIQRMEDEI
jgi:membrane protease YdiL (CAAX protease family)